MAPNDKKFSIPPWQLATSLPGAEDVKAEAEPQPKKAEEQQQKEPTHEAAPSEESKSVGDIQDLKEQAAKFLSDPSIKNASRERKVAFLESKGLKKEDVELLLSSQPTEAQPVVCAICPINDRSC
jgi:phospholipase/lecithinase/hemolysin